jgi:hypothetical protein
MKRDLTAAGIVALVFVTFGLLVWPPWRDRLDIHDARSAISARLPTARLADGHHVDGGEGLLVHVARGRAAADVLVAIAESDNHGFEVLAAAEQRDERLWVDDAACKNWAVAYRPIRGTREQAYTLALTVESAVNDATPNGPRDCQG